MLDEIRNVRDGDGLTSDLEERVDVSHIEDEEDAIGASVETGDDSSVSL